MRIVERDLALCYRRWLSIIPLLLSSIFISAQQYVDIWIVDNDGVALIGATIISLENNEGVVTDGKAYAKMPYISLQDKIQISYTGYETRIVLVSQILKLDGKIQLNHLELIISTIELIGRTGLDQRDIPYEVQNIKSAEIEALASQSSVDVMAQSGDVFVQKSQMGGGSPVMRGFEANKLLLVVDGVRMNNAIYRSGHLQNAITVDASGLSRIELIYGPNSLLYGSDALGGVIHFKTKDPKMNFDGSSSYDLNAYSRYSSANHGKSFHIDGSMGKGKWGGLLSMSYSDFGDLRSGDNRLSDYPDFGKRSFYVDRINGVDSSIINDDPNVQIGTAYSQWDLYGKLIYRPSQHFRISSNFQYSNSTNIPRYDQLNFVSGDQPKFADWHYGPQERLFLSTAIESKHKYSLFDEMKWIFAYQRIGEDRISRKFNNDDELNNEEIVNVASITTDMKKSMGNNKYFLFGAELNYNDVQSNAYSHNIVSNENLNNIATRYPDGGSTMTQMAAYAIWHYGWSHKANVELGVRANLADLNILYVDNSIVEWPDNYYEGINKRNSSITWSTGWNYETNQKWHWRALIASAFRSPNIDDFAKIRIKNDQINIPNITLEPERSYNAEIGIEKVFSVLENMGTVQFNFTTYYTRLFDLIVRDKFQFEDGKSTWEVDGDVFQVTANQNIANGEILGLSTSLNWKMTEHWSSDVRFNWLKGKIWASDLIKTPLPHIPPIYGNAGLSYQNYKWSVGIQTRWNGAKSLSEYALGSSDNEEYATPEGSLSWMIFDIHSSYDFNNHFKVQLRVNNLLDLHYRTFSSGVSSAGRNIIGTMRYKL